MSSTTFTLEFVVSSELTLDELWPDGDAPDDPTEEDVKRLVEDQDPLRIASEWNLDVGDWEIRA